jgi:hypothetical protein
MIRERGVNEARRLALSKTNIFVEFHFHTRLNNPRIVLIFTLLTRDRNLSILRRSNASSLIK